MNPQNWCFCPKSGQMRWISRFESMFNWSPLALTFPHFLNSPKFLSNNVFGLNPDRDKHLGDLDLEPTLGIVIKGSAQLQINLKLKPFTFVPGLNNFRPTLFPYLWIDEVHFHRLIMDPFYRAQKSMDF